MLVLEYAVACLLQVVASLGLSLLFYPFIKQKFANPQKLALLCFSLAHIAESFGISILAFAGLTPPLLLNAWFIIKTLIGAGGLWMYRSSIWLWTREHKTYVLWFLSLLVCSSLPTSNHDAFTAHFAVARLFLENGGLPLRADYEYLDALPLGAHMWYLPALSLGLEGGLNALSAIFSFATLVLIDAFWGRRIAFWSFVILMTVPQFYIVSQNPMVDTPSIFFSIAGFALLRNLRKHPFTSLLFSGLCFAMLFSIKQPLIGFLALWFGVALFYFLKRKFAFLKLLILIACILAVGGSWYFKTWATKGSPLYPHVGKTHQALIPSQAKPPRKQVNVNAIINYLKVVFLEERWRLSMGPWPLILMPLLLIFCIKDKSFRLAFSFFSLGFLLTLFFTPFKNRYFMPYLFILLPWMGAWMARSSILAKGLLALHAILTFLMLSPYILQTPLTLLRGDDKNSFYQRKFENYNAINRINALPEGKVLFIATPVYWLTRDHLLSIYSETHIDYTRMQDVQELKKIITENDIKYVAYDYKLVGYMSEHPDPWYSAKSHIARECHKIVTELQRDDSTKVLWDDKGIWVAEVTPSP